LIVSPSSFAVVLLVVSNVLRAVEAQPFRWYDWAQLGALAWLVPWNVWQWQAVRWVDRHGTWE
jgi:hypothetical protein